MIDIKTLPFVLIENKRDLPNVPAVYFVICDEEILYIGKAKSLASRWVDHHRISQVKDRPNTRIAWHVVHDDEDILSIERDAIDSFSPSLNNTPMPEAYTTKRVRAIAICLPIELEQDAKQAAQADGRSLSSYIAHLIRLDVQKRKQQQAA